MWRVSSIVVSAFVLAISMGCHSISPGGEDLSRLDSLTTGATFLAEAEGEPDPYRESSPPRPRYQAVGRERQDPPPPPRRQKESPPSKTGPASLDISVMYIPSLYFSLDKDSDEPRRDLFFKGKTDHGDGVALRVGLTGPNFKGDRLSGWISFGVLYMYTEHRETRATDDSYTQHHAAFLEVAARALFTPLQSTALYGEIALGVGGMSFDFSERFGDRGAAAFSMRANVGLIILRRVRLGAGGGFYVAGYPGETQGTAGFVTLELGVQF